MVASSGVQVMENGKVKRGPLSKKPQLHTNFLFGGTQTNFNTSAQSSIQGTARQDPGTIFVSPENGTIMPSDRNHLTITGEYDTYMITSRLSHKDGSRAASQGRINIEKKNFDIKTLILPKIPSTSKARINKSNSTQHLNVGKTMYTPKNVEHIKIEEDQSKIDEFNTNILINPSWGDAIKIKGLANQRANKMPKRKQSVGSFLNMKAKPIFGIKKRKEVYQSKMRLQRNNQIPSLSYRTIF